jgi:non-specific serine/threonine protein kinase
MLSGGPPPLIGKTISHYKILDKLGEGGMGVVYKAEDTKLKRTVALKFLSSQSLGTSDENTRFVHEAQAAAALDHPNICTVYEIDEADGHTFIVMAYIDGQSLREKSKSGPLKIDEALSVAIDVARGLQEAHEKDIVHRDIKSANVMVTKKGQAKITDFGLAKLADSTRITKTGTSVGTAAYMSPEQARGEEVDQRSDIWSLGVVIYEMLAGRLPFRGDRQEAVTYQIVHEDPEPITALRSGIPMELERIVNKCLEKDPANRYQHVDELLVDLGKIKRTPAARPKKSLFKFVLPASVVLLAAVLLVIFKTFQLEITPDESTDPVKLAVLPFENLGAPEDEYFADGITDEITSRLAVSPRLRVTSRTSVKQFKNTDKGLPEIGEERGVDYILEGTIRWDKAGAIERVRITPQLINVSDDFHLWAENYEREIEDIFAVQADIASQIAEALDITLLASERQTLEAKPTENLDAYWAYLRGLDLVGRRGEEDVRLGIQMFERAVELDPEFAVVYTALSQAHSLMFHFGRDRTEGRLSLARAAVDKAVKLQPELPEAHLALAFYYYYGYKDYERALEELAIAERGLPNDSRIIEATAWIWRRQGKFEAALDRMKKAFELSPLNFWLPTEMAGTCARLRRYTEAAGYFDQAISLAPDRQGAYGGKVFIYLVCLGDTMRARDVLEKMPGEGKRQWLSVWWIERNYEAILDFTSSVSEPSVTLSLLAARAHRRMGEPELAYASYDSARAILERELQARPADHFDRSALGKAYAGLGRKEEAIREGIQAVELSPVSKDAYSGPTPVLELAVIHTMVGEYDAALDGIEYLLSIPYWLSVHNLRINPTWDPLREHPRFEELLEKYAID